MAHSTGARAGSIDDMLPLKVSLPSDYTQVAGMDKDSTRDSWMEHQAYSQCNYMASLSTAEWSNAVNAVAPFLNAQGLKQALHILDCAIANIQRSKAVSEAAGYGNENAFGDATGYAFHRAAITAQLQAHMEEQQQMLMQELHDLPLHFGLLNPKMAVMPPVLPSTHPQMNFAAASMQMPWISSDMSAAMLPIMPDVCGPTVPDTCEASAENAGKSSSRRRAPQTLSSSLRLLENENPDCLIIVRRIGKLGFKAARSLKKHYSAYGHVTKVLLAHSTARQYCDSQFTVKRRPSNLGFIQMATADGAQKVLAAGAVQDIEGVSVSVQRFERHDADECDEEGEEVDFEAASQPNFMNPKRGKPQRGISEASTAPSPPRSFTAGNDSGSDL
jgi:hypothetical protein